MAPRARTAIAWPRREGDVHERLRSGCGLQAAIARRGGFNWSRAEAARARAGGRGPLALPRLNLQAELTRACSALLGLSPSPPPDMGRCRGAAAGPRSQRRFGAACPE